MQLLTQQNNGTFQNWRNKNMIYKELLTNAVDLLLEAYEDSDIFCDALLDVSKEEKEICGKCEGLNDKCVLRFLKNYKKIKELQNKR